MDILYAKCSLYDFFTLCCMIFLHFGCFGSRKSHIEDKMS